MKKIISYILILQMMILPVPWVWADNHNAADCSPAAIMAAVDLSSDDDTVTVPAGTCNTWTTKTAESITNQGGLCKVKITAHGWDTGAYVYTDTYGTSVSGCGAYPFTPHRITKVDNDHFTIDGSSFSGSGGAGAKVTPVIYLVNKGVVVQTSGTVTINATTEHVAGGGNGHPALITMSTVPANKVSRFTGFVLNVTVGPDTSADTMALKTSTGTAGLFRFDHNTVTILGQRSYAFVVSTSYGVIDYNIFYGHHAGGVVYGNVSGSVDGDVPWAAATDLGTNKYTYFENNRATNTGTEKSWAFIDCSRGGRYVARYNDLINHTTLGHGAINQMSSTENRACRSLEVYNNLYTCQAGATCYSWQESYGGHFLVYNNASSGPWSAGFNLDVQRVSDSQAWGAPWYKCDGTATHYWDGPGITGAPGYPCHDQAGVGPDTGDPNTTPQTITEPSYYWGNAGTTSIANSSPTYIRNGTEYCTHNTSTACGGITTTYTAYTCPHPLVTELAGTTCGNGAGTAYYGIGGTIPVVSIAVTQPTYGSISPVSEQVNVGDTVTATYTPNNGWSTNRIWGGTCGCTGTGACSFVATADCTITVTEVPVYLPAAYVP